MNTTIEVPEAQVIAKEHSGLLDEARSAKVTNQVTHTAALEILKRLSTRRKAIKEKLDPIADQANKVHKSITGLRAELLAPIEDVERGLSQAVNSYEEKERQERERKEREAEEAARKAEEERKLAEAIHVEKTEGKAAADEILSEPVDAPIVSIAPKLGKVEGVSARKSYSAEVVDLMALAKHVVAHPEDLALISANMTAVNARARSQREGFKLAGCRLVTDTVRSFRRAE